MTLPLRILAASSASALAAACALPLGATPGETVAAADMPVTCSLSVAASAGMVTVEGIVDARRPVTGRYELELRQSSFGGRSDIRQGGDFTLASGERAILGQATLSGSPADLDGTLTLTVDGKSYVCPLSR